MPKTSSFFLTSTLTSALCLSTLAAPPAARVLPEGAVVVYKGTKKSPVFTYRIPSMCVAKDGTILAFAELRKNNSSDTGDIDTVVRRSSDGGKTWSEEIVALDIDQYTIGNACPVVDPVSGRITVIATWNRLHEYKVQPGFGDDSRLLYRTYSDDNGKTWSKAEDISKQIKEPTWAWFATGPGAGIVKQRGVHRGRFVIGVNHSESGKGYFAHVIYSDDRGVHWKSSQSFAAQNTNECEVVELENGDLMLNMRNHGSAKRERAVAISKDGGDTWQPTFWDKQLPEPQCMGSIARFSWKKGQTPGVILFSNPASTNKRADLTLRASIDDGKTWSKQLLIQPGDAAYSHIARLNDGKVGILYETDQYREIVFISKSLNEMQDTPKPVQP